MEGRPMNVRNVLLSMISALCMTDVAYGIDMEIPACQEMQYQAEYRSAHHCLSLNLYHEARSEGRLGMKAVGWVTLNRVHSERYPNTVCDVVYQARLNDNGNPIRNQCQFSWWCDGLSDTPYDEVAWIEAQDIAHEVLQNYGVIEDPTESAIMYHASYVNPYWADSYDLTVRIGMHIFYK